MFTPFLATCVLVHGHDDGTIYVDGKNPLGTIYVDASRGDGYDQNFGAKGASVGDGYDQNFGAKGASLGDGYHRLGADEDDRMLNLWGLNDLSGEDSTDDSDDRLGHGAPHTGRLGEPCDGLTCDSGLYCKINNHGSYTTGTCVHETQHAGGEGQRCRTVQEGSPCDPGLQCNRVRFYPQGFAQICQRDHRAHPGSQGQRCRTVQEGSPCDAGLQCKYNSNTCEPAQQDRPGEKGQRCNDPPLAPCNRNNLAPKYEQMYPQGSSCTCHLNLAASGPSDNDDSNPKLGMPAPHLGGWYEPCRNTYPHCNFGLYCKHSYSLTATFGRCEPSNPQPSPTPQPAPQPNRGSEGQRCRNGSNQCDYGLDAVTTWEHQVGQALEYPVCRCQRPLGASDGSSKLGLSGVATPALGTEGEGCRNGSDGRPECDDGLFCLKVKDGKAILGVCFEKPDDHGGDNQPCYSAPLSPCNKGLKSSKKDGHCVCQKSLGNGDDFEKVGKWIPAGASSLGNGDDFEKVGKWIPAGASSPKLGMPAPDLGSENNGCRNGSDGRAPCNYGLYCDRWIEGTAMMGTCQRLPSPSPSPHRHCGGVGERCCGGSSCDPGLEAVRNWEHQYAQAFSVPSPCTCEPVLYGAAPGPN